MIELLTTDQLAAIRAAHRRHLNGIVARYCPGDTTDFDAVLADALAFVVMVARDAEFVRVRREHEARLILAAKQIREEVTA